MGQVLKLSTWARKLENYSLLLSPYRSSYPSLIQRLSPVYPQGHQMYQDRYR